jgi:hypothetical protein
LIGIMEQSIHLSKSIYTLAQVRMGISAHAIECFRGSGSIQIIKWCPADECQYERRPGHISFNGHDQQFRKHLWDCLPEYMCHIDTMWILLPTEDCCSAELCWSSGLC